MREAFIGAKHTHDGLELDKKAKKEFLKFINSTRQSIIDLISNRDQLYRKDYGSAIPEDLEGFDYNNIEATRDLRMSDVEDISMDVYFGREKMGAVSRWVYRTFQLESCMVVDITYKHKPSDTEISNNVFIINETSIDVWDRMNSGQRNISPKEVTLINELFRYVKMFPQPSGEQK